MRYRSVHISPGRRMIMLIPIHTAGNAILIHQCVVRSALLKKIVIWLRKYFKPPLRASRK